MQKNYIERIKTNRVTSCFQSIIFSDISVVIVHFHKIKILRLIFPDRKRLPQSPIYFDKNYLYSHRRSSSQESLQIFHFKRYNVKNVILPYKYVFIWHLVFGNRSIAEFRKANPKWIITTNSGFAYLHTPIWYLYLETVASGLINL